MGHPRIWVTQHFHLTTFSGGAVLWRQSTILHSQPYGISVSYHVTSTLRRLLVSTTAIANVSAPGHRLPNGSRGGEAGYRGSDDSQCHPTPSTWWISQLLPLFPQQPIKVSVIWVLWSSVWRTLECLSPHQSPVASITRSHKCRFPLSRCSVGSLLSHSGHFPQGCLGSKKILMQITASEMDLYTSIQSLLRHMW